MSQSLFFIPDISGYTNFIQTTEIEHSQHVIAELLEVLLDANIENLQLAEIEGDALFFYKEDAIPSLERLLAQIERMFKAFYSHLKLLESNRICPCNACASAPNLELKIVAHSGQLQFIEVQGNKKPFGKSVIESHRLLKNSIDSDNYVLITKELSEKIWLSSDYKSKLFHFQELKDTYDGEVLEYNYSKIDPNKLKLPDPNKPQKIEIDREPNLQFEYTFNTSKEKLYEFLSNYKYRNHWAKGVDDFKFKINEVTRLDTEHTCVINGQEIDFIAVTKEVKSHQLIYGEMTKSPPIFDVLYQFYTIESISDASCKVVIEIYWEAKSIFRKTAMKLFGEKSLKKGATTSMNNLVDFVNSQKHKS